MAHSWFALSSLVVHSWFTRGSLVLHLYPPPSVFTLGAHSGRIFHFSKLAQKRIRPNEKNQRAVNRKTRRCYQRPSSIPASTSDYTSDYNSDYCSDYTILRSVVLSVVWSVVRPLVRPLVCLESLCIARFVRFSVSPNI